MTEHNLFGLGRNVPYKPTHAELAAEELSHELGIDLKQITAFDGRVLLLDGEGRCSSRGHNIGVYRHGKSEDFEIWYSREPFTLQGTEELADQRREFFDKKKDTKPEQVENFLAETAQFLESGPYREVLRVERLINRGQPYILTVQVDNSVGINGEQIKTQVGYRNPDVKSFIQIFADAAQTGNKDPTSQTTNRFKERASGLASQYPDWETRKFRPQECVIETTDIRIEDASAVLRFMINSIQS